MNDLGQLVEFLFIWNLYITKCVEFSLISFGTLMYDSVIKTIHMFDYLHIINNSASTGFIFLLLIISAIISSETINTLRFFLDCILQFFNKYLAYHLSIQ